MSEKPHGPSLAKRIWVDIRQPLKEATYLTLISCMLGLSVNEWIHPRSIDIFAKEAYQILVPCPEPGGEVGVIYPTQALEQKESIFVDARLESDFSQWHIPNAFHLAYDYLEPTDPSKLQALAKALVATGKKKVIVYGDGENPDSGEQLGKEIASAGIKNVFYVLGGAKALRSRSRGSP